MSFWKKLFGDYTAKPDSKPAAPTKASAERTFEKTMTDSEVLTQAWKSMMTDADSEKVLSILRQSQHQAILSLAREYEQTTPDPRKNYTFRQKLESIMKQQFGMTRW